MTNNSKFTDWNFIAFSVLTFYTMGAGFLESLVNYPLWYVIGPSKEWIAYHNALGPRIIGVLAIPSLLFQLITNVLLFFFRPFQLKKWTVWLTLTLLMVAVISSAVIQIPIQGELSKGYSKELVDRLIQSDLIFRTWVAVIRGAIVLYMMYRIARSAVRK